MPIEQLSGHIDGMVLHGPNGARISRQWTAPIDDTAKAACMFEIIQQDTRQGRAINQQNWHLASWTDNLELVGNKGGVISSVGIHKSGKDRPRPPRVNAVQVLDVQGYLGGTIVGGEATQ